MARKDPEPADDEVFENTEIRGGDRPADYITEPVTGTGWKSPPFHLGDDDETDDEVGDAL